MAAGVTGALVTGALVTGALVTGAFVTGALVTGALVTGALVTGALVTGAFVTGTGSGTGTGPVVLVHVKPAMADVDHMLLLPFQPQTLTPSAPRGHLHLSLSFLPPAIFPPFEHDMKQEVNPLSVWVQVALTFGSEIRVVGSSGLHPSHGPGS